MKPIEMTKAQYMSFPEADRRRRKDGSYAVNIRFNGVKIWVPVKWSR